MTKYVALAAILAVFGSVRAQDADGASLIRAAEQAVKHAQYDQADALYAKAASLGDRPEIAPALWYLGAKAAGSGNRLAAEGFFERLLKVDPNGPHTARALTWLANMRVEDPASAEALFRRALAWLANVRVEDPASAEALYKQALAMAQPGSLDANETARSYAFLLRRQGRTEEAAALEETARAAGPKPRTSQDAPLPPGVYRAGGGVQAPSLLMKVEPQYTEDARAAKIQGAVVLTVDIGPDGVARNFEVNRSVEPGLDQKAIEAVGQWRFKPGVKDGAPVIVRATIEVNFRLM